MVHVSRFLLVIYLQVAGVAGNHKSSLGALPLLVSGRLGQLLSEPLCFGVLSLAELCVSGLFVDCMNQSPLYFVMVLPP